MRRSAAYRHGLLDGLPIALGYLPVGMTFGLVATQHGLSPVQVALSSLLMFSGAAQFMLVALLTAGTSWGMTLLLCLLLNARHVLYGPSIAARLPAGVPGLAVLSHGLTDEVFAVVLARLDGVRPASRPWWLGGVESAAFSAWVGASVIGALGGGWVADRLPLLAEALQFALPALFLILVMPYFTGVRRIGIVATIAVAAALSLAGHQALGILVASVIGALTCYRGMPWISVQHR